MLRFFTSTAVGIEITSHTLNAGVTTGRNGSTTVVASRSMPLPEGSVAEGLTAPAVQDPDALAAVLRTVLRDVVPRGARRIGLGLPDAMFRVQMLDFDKLPPSAADQERLIRWRLEKGGTFDAENMLLRTSVVKRGDEGFTVLACSARTDALSQFEDLFANQGLELWRIAPSSFHALNWYAPAIAQRGVQAYVLVWLTAASYSTLAVEQGEFRFYRFRELRPGEASEVADRLVRELGDALHFYTHRDRHRSTEVGHLFLAGDPVLVAAVDDRLRGSTTLEVEVLTPGAASSDAGTVPAELAPALGAGGGW